MLKIMFLNNKSILVMLNCMVSMETHYIILKRESACKNTHIAAASHPRTINLVSN